MDNPVNHREKFSYFIKNGSALTPEELIELRKKWEMHRHFRVVEEKENEPCFHSTFAKQSGGYICSGGAERETIKCGTLSKIVLSRVDNDERNVHFDPVNPNPDISNNGFEFTDQNSEAPVTSQNNHIYNSTDSCEFPVNNLENYNFRSWIPNENYLSSTSNIETSVGAEQFLPDSLSFP